MRGLLLALCCMVMLISTASFRVTRPMSRPILTETLPRLHGQHGAVVGRLSAQKSGDPFALVRSQGLSIGVGVTGIFILLVNRLSVDLDKVTDVQSRADIISVVACSALLLNVLSETDIEARDRAPVPLMGYALPSPLIATGDALNEVQSNAISWAIDTILRTTPATSVHIVRKLNEVVGRGGVVGLSDDRSPSFALGGQTEAELEANMGIYYKAVSTGEEVYLPDLQILPGKSEFGFLPANAQSLVILPLASRSPGAPRGAMVISTNQAKVLRMTDLQKIRVVGSLLKQTL